MTRLAVDNDDESLWEFRQAYYINNVYYYTNLIIFPHKFLIGTFIQIVSPFISDAHAFVALLIPNDSINFIENDIRTGLFDIVITTL